MNDLGYLLKTPDLDKSQDYSLLRREGLIHVQNMAKKLWTDYNIHDPGITILEHLCYALTDLGHRTGYDIRDLLTENHNGAPVNQGDFHTAREILTCNPVSFDDLRKLLIDIKGVRNAWIQKHESVVYCLDETRGTLTDCPDSARTALRANPPLNGLFDVFIEYEDFVQPKPRTVSLAPSPGGKSRRKSDFIWPENRGIRFDVHHDLTLERVSVVPQAPGEVVVRLLDAQGNLLRRSTPVKVSPGRTKKIPLVFHVPAGQGYRLDAVGTSVKLHHGKMPDFPQTAGDLLRLTGGVAGTRDRQRHYFFYDWEVKPASNPDQRSDDPPLMATTNPSRIPSEQDRYVQPQNRNIEIVADRDLLLESVTLYPETAGEVTVRLFAKDCTEPIGTQNQTLATAGQANRVKLGFQLKAGRTYSLDATGTKIKLLRRKETASSQSVPQVVRMKDGQSPQGTLHSFFDLQFQYWEQSRFQLQSATVTREDVLENAWGRLHQSRNLCQDFINICELSQEQIAVCADLEVNPNLNVETTLATIFHALERHVSPRVNFYTIDELLDRGKTMDEIFAGPKLDHGFIDDEEFQNLKRRCEIRSSDIIQIIMAVEGIEAVRNISLLSFLPDSPGEPPEGRLINQENWLLQLDPDFFQAPAFSPELSKIIFYKNGLPYFPDFEMVESELQELRAQDIAPKLKGHEIDLPVPVGQFRDLARFFPIQNEFPLTYRVGNQRVEASAPDLRKAQSRQLKAYLLFFEQVLANYLSQLAHVRELFSWDSESFRTYFTQAVTDFSNSEDLYNGPALRKLLGINEPEPEEEKEWKQELLEELLPAGLDRIIEDPGQAAERRAEFLEHLTSRFGENFSEYSQLMELLTGHTQTAREREIKDKRAFLADYPHLSYHRGQAHDYRHPLRAGNISGFKYRMYRLLGIGDPRRRDFSGIRFEVVELGAEEWVFQLAAEDSQNPVLFQSRPCTNRSASETLLDYALGIGGDPENWVEGEEANTFNLVRHCPNDPDEPIGSTIDPADLAEVVEYFDRIHGAEGFHLIENILLRKRSIGDPFLGVQLPNDEMGECPKVPDPYSFRALILLPSWPARFRNLEFRRYVEDTLRVEAPAHIYLRICWINHAQMSEFELKHEAWALRLADLSPTMWDCRHPGANDSESKSEPPTPSGQLPLPDPDCPEVGDCESCDQMNGCPGYLDYRNTLSEMIEVLENLVNVYPLARLYDCRNPDAESIPVSLDNTSLGTF